MSSVEKLKTLLESEIIPDLERVIDAIFQEIQDGIEISLGEKEELDELQEMHKECREILVEIEAKEMDEEEATELLDELVEIVSKS
jgi:DNA mismatch repair ATPase MutS